MQEKQYDVIVVGGGPAGLASAFEAKKAIEDGADEVDMVINVQAMKDKNFDYIQKDIEIVKQTNYIAKLSNNKLYINPEIVKFDKETIEYVIFHEFCHIQYKTHSKKFYEIMQNFFPNYKQIEENLVDYKF